MSKGPVDIYGILEYPLEKGYAAFIRDAAGLRRTSSVQHFIKLPSGVTHIYTKNTHYVLHEPTKAAAVGEVEQ